MVECDQVAWPRGISGSLPLSIMGKRESEVSFSVLSVYGGAMNDRRLLRITNSRQMSVSYTRKLLFYTLKLRVQ